MWLSFGALYSELYMGLASGLHLLNSARSLLQGSIFWTLLGVVSGLSFLGSGFLNSAWG
jgi:hypothetical protein